MAPKSHLIGKRFHVHLRSELMPAEEREEVEVLDAEHALIRLCFLKREERLVSWIPLHEIIALDEIDPGDDCE
jgi:hypothetical protein